MWLVRHKLNLTVDEQKKLQLLDGIICIGDLPLHLEAKLFVLTGDSEQLSADRRTKQQANVVFD